MRAPNRWIVASALGLLVVMVACGDRAATPTVDADAALEPGTRDWTTADGNLLRYTVGGKTDATVSVVLVHCWMCDRSFWDEQLPVLQPRFRTITLDLPGHGQSTADRETWSVTGFGEDVAGLVEELGLTDVILIGHSMGGPVSLHAAALLPGKVRGIVAVDTLQNAEFEFPQADVATMIRAFESDFVGTCNAMLDSMFPETDVGKVVDHVREVACDASRKPAGTALIGSFWELDMPALFRDAGVPIRAVNATGPNPTRIEVNRKYADYDAVLIDGVGHYLQMTRPELVNPLLLEAIDELLRR